MFSKTLIVLVDVSRSFNEYFDCQVIAIPAKYDYKPYAYGFQKDSPYLGIFNYYLKEMREKGTLKQILNQFESRPQVCPDYSGKPLGFDSCFTAFLALMTGMGLGLLLWILEWILDPFKARFNKRSHPPTPKKIEESFKLPTMNMLIRKDLQIKKLKNEVTRLQSRLKKYEPL